jgi:hypothetical protein
MLIKRAQTVTDYALIIAVVAAALLAMQTYFRRGAESIAKVAVDKLGGFDSGISPEEIQSMARQQELDPKYGKLELYGVETTTIQSVTATTKLGGGRSVTINQDIEHVTDKQSPGRQFYQRIDE